MNITFENGMSIKYTGKRAIKWAAIIVNKETGKIAKKSYTAKDNHDLKNKMYSFVGLNLENVDAKIPTYGGGFRWDEKPSEERKEERRARNAERLEKRKKYEVFITEVAA